LCTTKGSKPCSGKESAQEDLSPAITITSVNVNLLHATRREKKFPLMASSQSGKVSGRRLLLIQLEKCAVTESTSLCD